MHRYKVTFQDFDDELCIEYICFANSPVYAIIKAEEELKVPNWLDTMSERTIQVKMLETP